MTQLPKQQVNLAVRTIKAVAESKGKELSKAEIGTIARIACLPPRNVSNIGHWAETVIMSLHQTYAGAIIHFRASCRKHGMVY